MVPLVASFHGALGGIISWLGGIISGLAGIISGLAGIISGLVYSNPTWKWEQLLAEEECSLHQKTRQKQKKTMERRSKAAKFTKTIDKAVL